MKKLLLILVIVLFSFNSFAINNDSIKKEEFKFKTISSVETTSVKDQNKTGTCWDFATISFLESEVLRMGNGSHDLSEMFIVRNAYPSKAKKFVMLHGRYSFSVGGQAHDVIDVVRSNGIVPEELYDGLRIDEDKHNHGEMATVLEGMVEAVASKKGKRITPRWMEAFESVLDVYLGDNPENFEYQGELYTPLSFSKKLGVNADDYVELTSFNYYPFYEECILDVPDNWSMGLYYNLPLDEMVETMFYALENGYSIVWDGDMSDKYFSHKNGVAFVPENPWNDDMDMSFNEFLKSPQEEKNVCQEYREKEFLAQTMTDDHLMHLSGIVKDQNDIKYFITKNSWDTDSNEFGGYLNMSEQFIRLHTVAILVHKDALPKHIAKKLGIK